MSSFLYIDNKEKDILILGEGPTQGLDDIILTAEAEHPISFAKLGERSVSSLHCNGNNNFLFINSTKIYQFKAKHSLREKCPNSEVFLFRIFLYLY